MSDAVQKEIARYMEDVKRRNPGETVFQQAVEEVATSLVPFLLDHEVYRQERILERLTEPDRVIMFRVTWENDSGGICLNRAWRVQFSNAIGPYKGGMRFHPQVSLDVLKFLGFEQTLKNSLTGLPMGGAKGGSDLDPKGLSDREVMRFCQAMMRELSRHIGEDTDVPAGDIGVGPRELGYMFGTYLRMANRFVGTLTGKGLSFGGSLGRREATGYGTAHFLENMLNHRGDGVRGKTVAVSGSGNVAIYAIEKLSEMGATIVTASDSGGFVHDPDGIRGDKLDWLRELKEVRRGRIFEYAEQFDSATYHEGQVPWGVAVDLAVPCATENELSGEAARTLVRNGTKAVAEGANMPGQPDAVRHFIECRVPYGTGKAANAGGVAVSGLEQSQNALRISWSREEVEQRLQRIMREIHDKCVAHGGEADGYVNYVKGANVAGFIKVADAMCAYGVT